MPPFDHRRPSLAAVRGRVRSGLVAATLVALGVGVLLTNGESANAGIVPTVILGSTDAYSVLGATTVINTGPSEIGQSVGLSPGSSIIGFPPGIVRPPGTIEAANATTLQAQNDLTTAYDDAAGRSVEFTQTNPDLVGQTLIPGVYAATAKAPLRLSGQLVLDGQGNPDAVFIFQTDSTLITSSGSTIALINGASECNVFWQIGSSATLGSGSVFVGNILALTSVTVESSAVVHGRALARNGAVTLDNNVFSEPSCLPATETTTSAATTTSPIGAVSTTAVPTTAVPFGTVTTALPTTSVLGVDITDITLPPTGLPVNVTVGFAALALLVGAVTVVAARRPDGHS